MLSRQNPIDIKHRSTLRGIKKCKECGQFNGTRAFGCKNHNCPLAVITAAATAINGHGQSNGKNQMKKQYHTITASKLMKLDAIQLITYNDTRIYSVQVRERNVSERNFVEITDITLSSDENSYVFSRNAICYDDSCTFNAYKINCCKHVSHVLEEGASAAPTPHKKSNVCDVNCDKITLLNIDDDHRQYLKRIYLENVKRLAIVQRLTEYLFTIVCEKTQSLPSGILHITIQKNTTDIVNNVDEWFYCECSNKKLILKNFKWNYRKCCHFYMMIVAILSNAELQNEFRLQMHLINEFFHTVKSSIFDSNLLIADDFIKFSETILRNDCNIELLDGDFDYDNYNYNYLQMNNKSIDYNLTNNNNNCNIQNDVPDINCNRNSPIIHKSNNVEVIGYSSSTLINNTNNNNNNNNSIIEDRHSVDISSTVDVPSTYIHNNNNNNNNNSFTDNKIDHKPSLIKEDDDSISDNFQSLKFIDCQIELLDELISTDHIDLCNDDIYLNDLVDTAMNNYFAIDENISNNTAADDDRINININNCTVNDNEDTKSNSIIKLKNDIVSKATETSSSSSSSSSMPINKQIGNPKEQLKIKKKFQGNKHRLKNQHNNITTIKSHSSVNRLTKESKTKNYSIGSTEKSSKKRLENQFKRKYNLKRKRDDDDDVDRSKNDDKNIKKSTLKFDNWLDSIIERINITMDFNDNGKPEQLVFSVFHEFFERLSAKFSIGSKLRIPNETNRIQNGKYRGLTQFTYRFTCINVIRRIFTTKNMNIEIERSFIKSKTDNTFYKHFDDTTNKTIDSGKHRKSLSTSSYSTHLLIVSQPPPPQSSQFIINDDPIMMHRKTTTQQDDKVFQIDWIPNVLPNSKYGEMRILFEFEHRKNGFRILNSNN